MCVHGISPVSLFLICAQPLGSVIGKPSLAQTTRICYILYPKKFWFASQPCATNSLGAIEQNGDAPCQMLVRPSFLPFAGPVGPCKWPGYTCARQKPAERRKQHGNVNRP